MKMSALSLSLTTTSKGKQRKTVPISDVTDILSNVSFDRRNKLFSPETENEAEGSSEQDSSLAYTILSKEDSDQLLQMTVHDMESEFQQKFHLDVISNLKDAAILDYYVGATYWGQQQRYNSQQLSIFFTIVHSLLNKFNDEHVTLESLITYLQSVLVSSGTNDKSLDNQIFGTQQAKAIVDYLSSSLFQHYKLYLFMFSTPQTEEIITRELPVEVPVSADVPFPRCLDEGLPEDIFTRLLSFQPSPTSEESEEIKTEELELELPPNAEDIFTKLTAEDVKTIINEACTLVLNTLEAKMETKIKKEEVASLTKINKIHNVLSSSKKVNSMK